MDILSDIFETVQLRGTLYFRTDFSHPWGVTVPPLGRATRFHYVLAGSCWLQLGEAAPVQLNRGDFVLVPGGLSHILTSAPDQSAPPLEALLYEANYQGDGYLVLPGGDPQAGTQLVCGHFSFARGADHPLLRAMPDRIIITAADRERRRWLSAVLDLLATTIFHDPHAPVGVVRRLSEVVLLEALRSAEDEAPEVRRMIAGFADPRVGRAIALIHREPERAWTIDSLAREAAMSRTRFAARFRALIGTTPIAYLSEWRLQRAAALLASSSRPVGEIAHACGYTNAASFARAFAERFGETPNRFRQSSDPAEAG